MFARQYGVKPDKALEILGKKYLTYAFHRRKRRRKFPTLPVVVFGIDKQWVTDLVGVQSIARYDGRNRVLLVIIDVFYCKMRQKDRNPKNLRRMIAKNFPMELFRI